jgi:hypothetical protein
MERIADGPSTPLLIIHCSLQEKKQRFLVGRKGTENRAQCLQLRAHLGPGEDEAHFTPNSGGAKTTSD